MGKLTWHVGASHSRAKARERRTRTAEGSRSSSARDGAPREEGWVASWAVEAPSWASASEAERTRSFWAMATTSSYLLTVEEEL